MTISLWEFFPESDLLCKCGCGRAEMHPDFMKKLVDLRRACAFTFPITSAFRCAKHNASVSKTGATGPHTYGRAVDVVVRGKNAAKLVALASQFGMTGIGVAQKGHVRYIHLDDLPPDLSGGMRPWIWSY